MPAIYSSYWNRNLKACWSDEENVIEERLLDDGCIWERSDHKQRWAVVVLALVADILVLSFPAIFSDGQHWLPKSRHRQSRG